MLDENRFSTANFAWDGNGNILQIGTEGDNGKTSQTSEKIEEKGKILDIP